MSPRIKARVRVRAENRCEYCLLHQDDSPLAVLHVEHIVPTVHGGGDDLENLALACIDCNLHKGANLTGFDPRSRRVTRLFHPRKDRWSYHFEWFGAHIVGRTTIGPTTALVLDMNSEDRLMLRAAPNS